MSNKFYGIDNGAKAAARHLKSLARLNKETLLCLVDVITYMQYRQSRKKLDVGITLHTIVKAIRPGFGMSTVDKALKFAIDANILRQMVDYSVVLNEEKLWFKEVTE